MTAAVPAATRTVSLRTHLPPVYYYCLVVTWPQSMSVCITRFWHPQQNIRRHQWLPHQEHSKFKSSLIQPSTADTTHACGNNDLSTCVNRCDYATAIAAAGKSCCQCFQPMKIRQCDSYDMSTELNINVGIKLLRQFVCGLDNPLAKLILKLQSHSSSICGKILHSNLLDD